MLIESGTLNDLQLQRALEEHRKSHLRLGQYLVREGLVSEAHIADLIARQLGIEKYRPDRHPLDMGLAKAIPIEMAQRYQIAPLKKTEHLITIAMLDPLDIIAMDAIEEHTNTEVEALICTEYELNQLLASIYGTYSGIGNVLEDMEEMQYDTDTDAERDGPVQDIEVMQDLAEEAPVVRLVNSILSQAVREGASDIHLSPEKTYIQVRFRVDGKLHEVPAPSKAMILPILSRLKILANMDIATSRVPQDGRFTVKLHNREINIRASTVPTIYGENMVLRLLDTSAGVFSLEHLGMSEADRSKIEEALRKPYGMILSSGPTGSGKTTTLYSMLKRINQPDINIITLEDPVEYRIEKIRQAQLNRKAGMTFASGLRSILRQDPDVIMVGEIRDTETARIAVQAALTGHRVLSTVHTNDAAGAITRFIDMGIEPFLVASVMLACIAQRLVRTVCPNCKIATRPPAGALAFLGLEGCENGGYSRGKGCFHCMESGYRGRTAIFEVLEIDDTIQELILRRCSANQIVRAAREAGRLRTIKEDVADKVRRGITTAEEAISVVMG
jgi:type IV pilus assembly protein PilB